MISRVIYGIHLGRIVTTAKSNDSPDPRSVINNSTAAFSWFQLAVESSARTYALLSHLFSPSFNIEVDPVSWTELRWS